MTLKSPVRSADDVDEATLAYAEIKTNCYGQSAYQRENGHKR